MTESDQITKVKTLKVQAIIVLVIGFIGSSIVFYTGFDLTHLRSVGGTTVAEAYYQSIGSALIGISIFMDAASIYFAVKLWATKKVK